VKGKRGLAGRRGKEQIAELGEYRMHQRSFMVSQGVRGNAAETYC